MHPTTKKQNTSEEVARELREEARRLLGRIDHAESGPTRRRLAMLAFMFVQKAEEISPLDGVARDSANLIRRRHRGRRSHPPGRRSWPVGRPAQ
jgi:hypothetical protein